MLLISRFVNGISDIVKDRLNVSDNLTKCADKVGFNIVIDTVCCF